MELGEYILMVLNTQKKVEAHLKPQINPEDWLLVNLKEIVMLGLDKLPDYRYFFEEAKERILSRYGIGTKEAEKFLREILERVDQKTLAEALNSRNKN